MSLITPAESSFESLKTSVRGEVLLPDAANYDEARSVWNGMIDRRPAAIVRCTGVADVKACLAFAKEAELEVCMRGAGHHIAGSSVREGGLMMDLSDLRSVSVDPIAKRVVTGPGATLGDIDHETKEYGLALPTGINSTTGISGLTLGGGIGWLTRAYGMTIDSLVSAEVVTADGEVVTASETDNPDLFWAIRGGGGNFGIVTRWEFQLQAVGSVLAGLIVFPESESKQVLQRYRDYVQTLPTSVCVMCVLRRAPPLPFLPVEAYGQNVLLMPLCYTGDPEEGRKYVDMLRSFGTPLGEHVGVMPFASWQQAFDPLLAAGARNYWKSHNFTELTDELFDTLVEYAAAVPHAESEIFIVHLEGHLNTVSPDAMAYPHREKKFLINMHGRWQDADDDEFCIQWARDLFAATKRFASKGAYTNFMTEEETDRIREAYGPNYARLARIKAKYDPKNVFNCNQNIKPSES